MNLVDLIGLEIGQAQDFLQKSGITNYKFVYYVDRKQTSFDKEIVTAVRDNGDCLEIIICRYLIEI